MMPREGPIMKRGWGPGPVFAFECRAATRRGWLYAGRALFVVLLLVGLGTIWAPAGTTFHSREEAAGIARGFFLALVSIQLAVVLLVVPAVTAGAVCVDKSRGTLHHVFVTDLTAHELVLGKLASRLVALLGLLACGLPVLALSGLLGGIDMVAALGAYLVTLGVGVLACALTLTFSVWARKPHQALLPAYLLLGVWAGTLPVLAYLGSFPVPSSPGEWAVALSSPFFAAFAPELDPTRSLLGAQAEFLGVTVLFALGLVLFAARHVRRVAVEQASRPARVGRPGLAGRLVARLPGPSLDANPVFWREWHRKRPSRWTGRLWTAYASVAFLASLGAVVWFYLATATGSFWQAGQLPALVNAGEVAIGLLLLSISAPLALAEERDRGSLDVINATALPTRSIVWGKWLGTFAIVPRMVILPLWVAIALALVSGRWGGVPLLVVTLGIGSAMITSLGLALATWSPRANRAVAASLLAYVLWTVGTLVLSWFLPWYLEERLLLANPCVVVFAATADAGSLVSWNFDADWRGSLHALGWIVLPLSIQLTLAAALFAATLLSFDHCLGRMPDQPRRSRNWGDRRWGALLGGICGATGAFTVLCAAVIGDEAMPPVFAMLLVLVYGAFLGISAGWGVIGPTGWRMIVGALLGWAGTGSVAVFLRQDAWGIVDGAILGVPLGLFLGFVRGLERERARSARRPHPDAGS
jgi:ABC-type transport system involved in multi-copper enzyme maturation permease subunit